MRARPSTFAGMAVVWLALVCLPAHAAPGSAAGRKHAAKANHLAAQNKCKSAVVEFTKAYKLLKDPALLFNRAECYRKIGKDSQAVKDYAQFLTEMPKAPNRSTIEARIASLRGNVSATQTTAAKSPAKSGEPPKSATSDAASLGDEGTVANNGQGVGSAAIGTAAPVANESQAAANLTTPPLVPEPNRAGRSHAWVWIGTAVVVVGAGAFAAYHYWPRPKADVPQTPLGNYAF